MTTVVYTADGWVPAAGVAGATPPPPDPDDPPGAVTILSVLAGSSSELTITWLPPNTGGPVTHYTILLDGVVETAVKNGSPHTIGGLEADTEYDVGVRAVGPGGDGATTTMTGLTAVAPPASSLVEQWDSIIASGDLPTAIAAFDAGTGYQAAGWSLSQLQAASGSTVANGQVIEGKRITGAARWGHSNVTYRGCLIEWSSSLYGAYGNPTFGNAHRGILFEYCTFIGPATAPDGARRCGVISANTENAVTFRYCDFYGGTSGIANDSSAGGAIVEYSWIHDLAAATASNGAHRTCLRTTSGGGRFYRNLCTDGGSSCISMYFDKNPIHNFEIRENIMDGSSPNASPSFLINMKEGEYVATATNNKVVNNYFGTGYQFGLINGVGNFNGLRGNEVSGNVHFATGDPI